MAKIATLAPQPHDTQQQLTHTQSYIFLMLPSLLEHIPQYQTSHTLLTALGNTTMSTSCPGVEELPDPPAKNKTRNTEAEGSSTTITDQANANVVLPPAAASEMGKCNLSLTFTTC